MLSKSVLATVAYYDAFDYPVTGFEVWKHLLIPEGTAATDQASLPAVTRVLEDLGASGRIRGEQGFWMLPDRAHLVDRRISREKRAVTKLKRASRLARACAWLPYVRMIALTGSLSMKQGDRESDWDFLVVMRGGAIWTGRLFLTLWLTVLGRRRHGDRIPDRACLNCYLTDTTLEVPLRDVFSSHEYRFLYPVVGAETYRSFELANRWMGRYRPNFLPTVVPPLFLRRPRRSVQLLQSVLEAVLPLSLLEPWCSRFEKRLIERNPKTLLSGGYISATDAALIFLPEPKGPKIFESFKERLSRI